MIENAKEAPDITHFHEKQLATLREANDVLRHRVQDLEGRCVTLQNMTEGLRDRNVSLEEHCDVLMKQLNVKNVAQMVNNAWTQVRKGERADTAPDNPTKESALDVQVGGRHYKSMGAYQPWEVAFGQLTPEELKGAMKLTVQAYLAREADKGGMEDIRKASHTLQIYLELESRRGTNVVQRPDAAHECERHERPEACAQPGPGLGV